MALSAGHHAVIQTLMSHGPRSESATKQLVHDLLEGASLEPEIRRINAALSVLQLEVRGGVNQRNGSVWYGLVNRAADKEAKLGTKYSHAQIQLFKAIVEHIASSSNGSGVIGSIAVKNLVLRPAEDDDAAAVETSSTQRVAAPKVLTGPEKDLTLQQLVSDKWLEYAREATQDGSDNENSEEQEESGRNSSSSGVKLGIRAYLELRQYLKSIEGVPVCELCNEAAIEARPCPSDDCEARVHFHCERAHFRRPQDAKCPSCRSQWPHVPSSQTQDSGAHAGWGSQRGGAPRGKRRKAKADR